MVSMESSNAVVSRVFVLTEVVSGEEGVVAFYYDVSDGVLMVVLFKPRSLRCGGEVLVSR